jgi:hypothetical protein
MFAGRRFRLKTSTLAVVNSGYRKVLMKFPSGTMLEVVTGRVSTDGMVLVMADERPVLMFAQDVKDRGESVSHLPDAGEPEAKPETRADGQLARGAWGD